ncbi:TraG family conjugative transposon ATPase [Salinimicrobium sp. CDJ15-81-2]|uniref:TraG family conjugative transposon ATPase n=5 Tax=Flavobacteriaceae TaxID=49546 RepID=A0A9X3I1G1_9FLAO|nr:MULTISPECIES: TraG family conjugative transposon ATPase [Flavobacteriaceae]MDX1602337.1 TraG family conjugative transposon ATPase [Salinimicrobium sediminis]NJY63491.1 TraG family conjugative transposon ATPase [Salinimicrobium nanhaiense]MCX2838418.1 TraG family conjugative transposon ATPase [Salinimicrobium profundisediminis]MDT0647105.1 TraG family conjugative transposon ATPase [Zunongwangia sp. F260]NJW52184.1 TraG family conjugative transposon ATPase [Salinimicrobium oceani]
MNKINLSDFTPIIDIQDNIIFANNGNVVLCYEGMLPEIYSLSEKDFKDIHGVWFQALKSLPNGSVVHKQDIYLKKSYSAELLPNTTFLEKATHEHFKGREYMEHRCYLFFILTKNKALNNPKYVNPFRKVSKGMCQELDDNLKSFISSVSDSVSFINNSRRMSFLPLGAVEIQALTNSFFNGFSEGFDTDMLLNKSNIQVGDNYFDALAINSERCFGETVQSSKVNERFTSDEFIFHQGFIDGLGLTLNENHMVNQILYLDDKQKWRKLLDNKIEELHKSSNFGSQNKVVLGKIQHILDQINADDTSRIIRGHFNVIYWAKEAGELAQIASKVKTEFKELDITPYYPRGEERKNYVVNSYCCFSSNFSNSDLYVTDLKHALCLLINNTNYKSDPTGIIFNDREHNIPVLKDVWDEGKKRIKARNFAIFAPTGEGKSFLANNILRQYFESGVRLVIIDLGGSYTKFAKLYPEKYTVLRYESGKNLGINPFYISNSEDVTPERLEDLSMFLFELFGSDLKVTKAQSVSIRKILLHYYSNVPEKHSLDNFYRFVETNQKDLLQKLKIHADYFNIVNFLHVMSEYVGDGLYSFLFEISEDQTYKIEDKRLIVFELDEVKDNKEVLSVMLKLIKSAIQRTIWKNRAEKGIILFDEFAKQLKFENVLESVEFYYQAIRKQNGAIGIILQSINQLPNNSISASILENTQVIYSLHNEKGYNELAKRLNLSSHDLNQLKSIRNNLSGERKYTEMFIKIGKESNVFRLEVPREVYAAYLTDGYENEEIMKLYEKHQDMEKAITEYSSKKIKI